MRPNSFSLFALFLLIIVFVDNATAYEETCRDLVSTEKDRPNRDCVEACERKEKTPSFCQFAHCNSTDGDCKTIAGPPLCFTNRILGFIKDRTKASIDGKTIPTSTAAECQAKCQGLDECAAFTWRAVDDDIGNKGECYLKSYAMRHSALSSRPCDESRVQGDCEFDMASDLCGGSCYKDDTVYVEGGMEHQVKDAAGCQQQCQNGSFFWTFHPNTQKCFVDSRRSVAKKQPGAVSGPRTCDWRSKKLEYDVMYTGEVIANLNLRNFPECYEKCLETPGCKFWTSIRNNSSCTLLAFKMAEEEVEYQVSGAVDYGVVACDGEPRCLWTSTKYISGDKHCGDVQSVCSPQLHPSSFKPPLHQKSCKDLVAIEFGRLNDECQAICNERVKVGWSVDEAKPDFCDWMYCKQDGVDCEGVGVTTNCTNSYVYTHLVDKTKASIKGETHVVESIAACQSLCQKERKCVNFLYRVVDDQFGNKGECYLKDKDMRNNAFHAPVTEIEKEPVDPNCGYEVSFALVHKGSHERPCGTCVWTNPAYVGGDPFCAAPVDPCVEAFPHTVPTMSPNLPPVKPKPTTTSMSTTTIQKEKDTMKTGLEESTHLESTTDEDQKMRWGNFWKAKHFPIVVGSAVGGLVVLMAAGVGYTLLRKNEDPVLNLSNKDIEEEGGEEAGEEEYELEEEEEEEEYV